jgi:hypothetical protein
MILIEGSVERVTIKGQRVRVPKDATHFDLERDMWAFANAGPPSGWRFERIPEIIGSGSAHSTTHGVFGRGCVGETRITLFLKTADGLIPVDPEGREHFANCDSNNISLTLDDRMIQSLISPTAQTCGPARLFCKDVYEVQWHVWRRADLKRAWRAVHADSRRAANGRLGYKHIYTLLGKMKADPESFDAPLRCLIPLYDIMARNLEGVRPLLVLQATGSKSTNGAVVEDEVGMLFRAASRGNTALAIGSVEVAADKDCEFGEFDILCYGKPTTIGNANTLRPDCAELRYLTHCTKGPLAWPCGISTSLRGPDLQPTLTSASPDPRQACKQPSARG